MEDMLLHGPFVKGQLVTYHGTLYDIPEGTSGIVDSVNEVFGVRVLWDNQRINCCEIMNLRRQG